MNFIKYTFSCTPRNVFTVIWRFLHKPLSFIPLRREWRTRPTFCSHPELNCGKKYPCYCSWHYLFLLTFDSLSLLILFWDFYYLTLVVLSNSIVPSFVESSLSSEIIVHFRREITKFALSLTFSFSILLLPVKKAFSKCVQRVPNISLVEVFCVLDQER